jgi:hypothetical protein
MKNLVKVRRNWSEISRRIPRTTRWLEGAASITVRVIDAISYPIALLLDGVKRLLDRMLEGTGIPDPPGLLGPALHPRAQSWIDDAHFAQLVEIGAKAFPGCGLTRETRGEMFARWLGVNPNVLRFIVIEDGAGPPRRIGYTCILPLKKESYYRYYRGELSEYVFSSNDITKPSYVSPPRYICLQAFALDQRKVDQAHWVALYQHIVMHLYVLMRGSTTVLPKIIAEGETRSGKRVLARRGFVQVGLSASGFPLYELDLATPESEMRKEAADTRRELLRLFKLLAPGHAELQARRKPFPALPSGSTPM